MCKTSGGTDPTDLASFGEEEDDGSVKLKKYVGWWEAELIEKDRRNFSAGVKADLEANVTELSGEKRDRRVEPRCGAGCPPSPRRRQ